ncbi:uncharacterized protein E0L32_006379 [Thyridium curvatum]|uniref:Deacetylase complex subunit n=1 Tax=Thyridium curvatum TaxID=1093900 RepID=A0A507B6Z5_9PEZI|nr:uncharacterized protein E0L32_006379 [Thyridium curvatum]TPX13179.1 hypothetical protein E0L32_006379 [Thyridium curvatum]
MAAADSQVPPLEGGASSRADRHTNGSPPPPQSKRDKKRQMINDRLAALSEKFNRDRDVTYREQLQKIQIDTNLVMRIDPYLERPLDAIEAERQQSQSLTSEADQQGRAPGPTLLEMAGPNFNDWLREIEDLVEQRDTELTKQKNEYRTKANEYKWLHRYKTDTARREHKALSRTLRDRLINAITAKKLRLSKEKEALEISDASALLLHPNQFSITNPSSPGGTHSKRATRLRHNAEDLSGYGDSRKRKRNGADDDGSPAPQKRLDANGTTPLWHGDRLGYRKVTGPVYSVDKLFTDKELAMTYNAASLAAHKYLLTHRSPMNGANNGASTPSDSDSGDHNDNDDLATPAAMERAPSHATRSTRGVHNQNFVDDKLVGIEALANFEMPGNLEKMIAAEPKMPPSFLSNYAKPHSKAEANTPNSLPVDDISSDLRVMNVLRQYEAIHGTGSNLDTENGSRRVLEAMAFTANDEKYAAYLEHERKDPDELRKSLKIPTNDPATPGGNSSLPVIGAPPAMPPITASPMSRQSSQGGVAMSRQGSSTRAQRKRN